MKKRLLLLISFVVLLNVTNAQTSGGPDTYGYVWRNNTDANGPVYNWVDITTNPNALLVTGLTDDNIVGPFQLSSPFHFYWYDVSKVWVGSNGYIGFTNGQIASNGTQGFPNIPDPAGVNNYIGAFLTDLNFTGAGNTGQCYIYQSPGGDSLVVAYINVPFWQNGTPPYTGSNSFEIILNKNDSSILIQYESQSGASPGTQNVTFEVGIENNAGNIGLPYLINTLPVAASAVKYYYPATTTFQVSDASTSWCNNPNNQGIFLTKNAPAFDMTANFSNSGNTPLAGFNATAEIRTAASTLIVGDTQAVGALAAGSSSFVTFSAPFYPTTTGLYQMICNTLLTGDATPTNNSRTLEVNVVDATSGSAELAYEDGIEAGAGGIGWSGGDGGIAMHFVPPFYPCTLSSVEAYIVDDPNSFGYSMLIYADDGPGGSPLTLLDSVNVAAGTFSFGTFTTTALTSPIQIDSGGFYVLWYMGGDGVSIGQNVDPPFSFQAYEVLGGTAPANFALYRNVDAEDLMIRAIIEKVDILCGDSISAGIASTNETWVCFGDTVTFTSHDVIAPNEGAYSGIGWIISSADISGSIDPMNEPSFVATSRFSSPAPSQSATKFVNDSTLIGIGAIPFGIYYWTPVVFGNATSSVVTPVLLSELSIDTSCILTGNSVMVNIVEEARPQHVLTSNSPLLCDSLSMTINLSTSLVSSASYSWTGPNGFASTDQSPVIINASPADSGWYYVTITGTGGCSSSDSLLYVVDTLPHAEITASGPTTFCDGDSVTLTASPGSGYLWSPNNEITQSITVTASGTFQCLVNTPNGCAGDANTSAMIVTVNPNPAVPVITQVNDSIINNVTGTSYKWFLNGVLQLSKTTQSIRILPSQNGNWYVVVTNAFGCFSTSNILTTNVGINELTNSSYFTVYPNPGKGVFTVELKSANHQKTSIKIQDLTGRVVYSENNITEKFIIDLSEKAKGVYYLQLNDGNEISTGKLIIQ